MVPWKILRVPEYAHMATFHESFNGLLFRSILWMRLQNLKFLAWPVPDIIRGTQKIGQKASASVPQTSCYYFDPGQNGSYRYTYYFRTSNLLYFTPPNLKSYEYASIVNGTFMWRSANILLLCYAERCISYDRFCPPDRLSHAAVYGIMPKRLQLRSCGLHWRIAPWL